jgi:hypothetical protein
MIIDRRVVEYDRLKVITMLRCMVGRLGLAGPPSSTKERLTGVPSRALSLPWLLSWGSLRWSSSYWRVQALCDIEGRFKAPLETPSGWEDHCSKPTSLTVHKSCGREHRITV